MEHIYISNYLTYRLNKFTLILHKERRVNMKKLLKRIKNNTMVKYMPAACECSCTNTDRYDSSYSRHY